MFGPDIWLLDKVFTPLAAKIRQRSGATQYVTARECFTTGWVLLLTSCLLYLFYEPRVITVIMILFLGVWLRPFEFRMIDRAEQQDNFLFRENNTFVRSIMAFFLVLNLLDNHKVWDWLSELGMTFYVFSLYFRAVILPPPPPPVQEFKVAYA